MLSFMRWMANDTAVVHRIQWPEKRGDWITTTGLEWWLPTTAAVLRPADVTGRSRAGGGRWSGSMNPAAPSSEPLPTRQLRLLRRMAELENPPCVFGGYAEDALLAGTVTPAHLDVNWLVPRNELELRRGQAQAFGFTEFETWGEAAPGEPFYLCARNGDLSIDIGVSDEADEQVYGRIWRVAFEIDGQPAHAGYRFDLPSDTYSYPVAQLDNTTLRVASPLALYQLRAAISTMGSCGGLCPRRSRRVSASCAKPSSLELAGKHSRRVSSLSPRARSSRSSDSRRPSFPLPAGVHRQNVL